MVSYNALHWANNDKMRVANESYAIKMNITVIMYNYNWIGQSRNKNKNCKITKTVSRQNPFPSGSAQRNPLALGKNYGVKIWGWDQIFGANLQG